MGVEAVHFASTMPPQISNVSGSKVEAMGPASTRVIGLLPDC